MPFTVLTPGDYVFRLHADYGSGSFMGVDGAEYTPGDIYGHVQIDASTLTAGNHTRGPYCHCALRWALEVGNHQARGDSSPSTGVLNFKWPTSEHPHYCPSGAQREDSVDCLLSRDRSPLWPSGSGHFGSRCCSRPQVALPFALLYEVTIKAAWRAGCRFVAEAAGLHVRQLAWRALCSGPAPLRCRPGASPACCLLRSVC